MHAFTPPYAGIGKFNQEELVQALFLDVAAEMETIFLYHAHARASKDQVARKNLENLRDQEIAHIGQLMALMRYLRPDMNSLLNVRQVELVEMMEEFGIKLNRDQPFARKAGSMPPNPQSPLVELVA